MGTTDPMMSSGALVPVVRARGTSRLSSGSHRYTVEVSQSATAGTVAAINCTSSATLVTRDSSSENESRVLAVASLRRASESTAKTSRAVAAYSAYSWRTLGSEGGHTAPGGK